MTKKKNHKVPTLASFMSDNTTTGSMAADGVEDSFCSLLLDRNTIDQI